MDLPKTVKSRAVFLTINPVTQREDDAVNRASMNEIPFVVEIGKLRIIVPTAIIPRYPKIRTLGALISFECFIG